MLTCNTCNTLYYYSTDEVGDEIDFSECEKGTKHAFVVDDSECVAEVTYKWYLEQIITSEKKSTSTSIEEL